MRLDKTWNFADFEKCHSRSSASFVIRQISKQFMDTVVPFSKSINNSYRRELIIIIYHI